MNAKSAYPNCENAPSRKFSDNQRWLTEWMVTAYCWDFSSGSSTAWIFNERRHVLVPKNLRQAFTSLKNSLVHKLNLPKSILLSKTIILSSGISGISMICPSLTKKSLGVHKQNLHDAHQQRISWQRCFKWVSDVCPNWTQCSMISFPRWVCLIDFAVFFLWNLFLMWTPSIEMCVNNFVQQLIRSTNSWTIQLCWKFASWC